MKTTIKVLSLLLFLNLSSMVQAPKASAQVGVSFQFFYDNLSPYGTWVNYPQYGYAWIPSVSGGFSPYATGGHWVFTQFGWMWVSDYPWGWAAFHYGSWNFDPMYGWMWIPGMEWAPAWVVWSSVPGYYGWAPIGPGVNINVVINGGYHVPAERWVFVPRQYIASTNISRYYGPRAENTKLVQNVTIIKNTQVDNSSHVTYIAGPSRADVEKSVGKKIAPMDVKNMDKPGEKVNGNEVQSFRNKVQEKTVNGQKPAPKEVKDLKEVQEHRNQNAEPAKQAPAPQKVTPKEQPKAQPRQQNEPPKKPKQEEPNPKTMRQTDQHQQYDYAMKTDLQLQQKDVRQPVQKQSVEKNQAETNKKYENAVRPDQGKVQQLQQQKQVQQQREQVQQEQQQNQAQQEKKRKPKQ